MTRIRLMFKNKYFKYDGNIWFTLIKSAYMMLKQYEK